MFTFRLSHWWQSEQNVRLLIDLNQRRRSKNLLKMNWRENGFTVEKQIFRQTEVCRHLMNRRTLRNRSRRKGSAKLSAHSVS